MDNSEEFSQPDMQDEGNKDAARALLRVKQKLDGYEGGEMRSLQGQVENLCKTFLTAYTKSLLLHRNQKN